MSTAEIRVIYDGGCPISSACVRRLRPRSPGTRFALVDGRADPGIVRSLAAQGLDLNEGVVVEAGGARRCGPDAARTLAQLHRASGLLERLAVWAFESPRRAGRFYPVFRFCRRLALRVLHRQAL
jgi:predicted DCC family thiol-disulfide oxidoreductase YuxK